MGLLGHPAASDWVVRSVIVRRRESAIAETRRSRLGASNRDQSYLRIAVDDGLGCGAAMTYDRFSGLRTGAADPEPSSAVSDPAMKLPLLHAAQHTPSRERATQDLLCGRGSQ